VKSVVDMDFEFLDKKGDTWKDKYGEMTLETAKISLSVINCLSFVVMLTMSIFMLCLFYRGLKWGIQQT